MNTLKTKIIRWLKRDWYHIDVDELAAVATSLDTDTPNIVNMRNSMSFSLVKADGGYIVQYRKFDNTTHENEYNLHIITSDQNIGDRIGQIITLELLRH